MSNYKDFRNKNTQFTGNVGIDLPTGTTAQRATTFGSGTLRFNTTTGLMEYYTGTDWKAIDAPPVVTSYTVDGGSAILEMLTLQAVVHLPLQLMVLSLILLVVPYHFYQTQELL